MDKLDSSAHRFPEVLEEELRVTKRRRELLGLSHAPEDGNGGAGVQGPYASAHRAQLAGLAFSGGGIRSATFNLGVIQALSKMGLLRTFDYLSTVSGGGYIGS